MTFKHSGKLGDLIYCLPTIRAAGGGVLVLNTTNSECERFTPEIIPELRELLIDEPYIHDVVEWDGSEPGVNLDTFRNYMDQDGLNAAESCLKACQLSLKGARIGWLRPRPGPAYPAVIARSFRARSPEGKMYREMLAEDADVAVFVGLPEEHADFITSFENLAHVPLIDTPRLTDLAAVIANCGHFYGNQSSPRALAEAYKRPVSVEIAVVANTVFQRSDAHYWIDGVDLAKVSK